MQEFGMNCMHVAVPQNLLTEIRLKLGMQSPTASDHTLTLHLESDKKIDQSAISLPFPSACLQRPAGITGRQAFVVSHVYSCVARCLWHLTQAALNAPAQRGSAFVTAERLQCLMLAHGRCLVCITLPSLTCQQTFAILAGIESSDVHTSRSFFDPDS